MIDFGLRNILRRCAKFCEGRLQKSRNCLRSRGCIVTVMRVAVDSDFIGCSTGWGLSAGYQPRPQVVDRGTTARYGGQLRYI